MITKSRRSSINILITLLCSLIIVGTIGYKVLLNVSFVDALYMTVITISTVGYGEIGEMDNEAKLFSIILIFISLGTVGYLFSTLVNSLLEGDFKRAWRLYKMESNLKNIKDHYIICGAPETGNNAIKEFKRSGADFIVIDKSEEKFEKLLEKGIFCVLGDANEEDTLEKAGIKKAKGLITSLPSDSDNVYTVLTARQMNPDLYIVSRAIDESADKKLINAGADNTICPNEIGGSRMAGLILRPNVISFLDVITHARDVILDLEEVTIFNNSKLLNKKLKEAQIPQKTGLIVLAIKKHNTNDLKFNPSSNTKLEEGDVMVVLGQREQVDLLRDMSDELI